VKLVTISTAFNPADAHVMRTRLEAAGFDVFVKNETAALTLEGYALTAGGIQVQVPEDQVEEAKEFLNTPFEPLPGDSQFQ
jgi:hypothetical protein